jgi:integrase
MADKRVWIADRAKHKDYQAAVVKAKSAKRQPPGRWRVAWIDPEGNERSKTFQTLGTESGERKDTAHWWRRKMERELNGDAGSIYIDPNAAETLFSEVAETWWAARDTKRSSKDRYRTVLDTHVLPHWGTSAIGSINSRDLAAWMARLKRGGGLTDLDSEKLGASQKRSVFTVMNSILDWAVPEIIPANPMQDKKKLKRPRPNKVHDHAYLDYLEIEALADVADGLLTKRGRPAIGVVEGTHGLLIRTLAYTGLRMGEALALRVEHVRHQDAQPVLQVRSTLVEDDRTGEVYFQDPKTNESRDVPIPASLVPAIKELCARRGKGGLVFSASGEPVRLRNWRTRIFNLARDRLEFTTLLTPHKLRHTAASLAIRAGATPLSVCRLLGHASPAETLNTYAHLWDDEVWAVAAALDRGRLQAMAEASEIEGIVGLVAEIAVRLDEVQLLLGAITSYDGREALHTELARLGQRTTEVDEFLREVAGGVDRSRRLAIAG